MAVFLFTSAHLKHFWTCEELKMASSGGNVSAKEQ